MKKYIIISVVSCISLSGAALAQTASDALLFSRHYAGGTARSAGMSGAFGALGGDISVISTNPAGLAIYRGTEFSFTPALNIATTIAEYDDKFKDNDTRFIFNSLGYVFTRNMHNEKGLISVSFGLAYNRLSDFNGAAYVKKRAASSSLLDEFALYANLYPNDPDPFYEGLAIDVNAVWEENGEFINDYILEGIYGQPLSRTMNYRGGIGEYGFSMGLNFNHNLYFGATIGIQELYYRERYDHRESPGFDLLDNFRFIQNYTVNGWGVNFKTGIIYRPVPMLRLGASVHTPSHLWMKEELQTDMETIFNNPPLENDTRTRFVDGTFLEPPEKYQLTTPWRYSFSAAAVIGKIGMIGADVEYVDHKNTAILPRSDNDFENNEISLLLKPVVNVKTGAEIRLGPINLRGGVAFYGNPFDKNQITDETIRQTLKNTISYSAGIGFRNRDFYMDAAYTFMKQPRRIYDLYEFEAGGRTWYESAKLQTNYSKALVTFGFRF